MSPAHESEPEKAEMDDSMPGMQQPEPADVTGEVVVRYHNAMVHEITETVPSEHDPRMMEVKTIRYHVENDMVMGRETIVRSMSMHTNETGSLDVMFYENIGFAYRDGKVIGFSGTQIDEMSHYHVDGEVRYDEMGEPTDVIVTRTSLDPEMIGEMPTQKIWTLTNLGKGKWSAASDSEIRIFHAVDPSNILVEVAIEHQTPERVIHFVPTQARDHLNMDMSDHRVDSTYVGVSGIDPHDGHVTFVGVPTLSPFEISPHPTHDADHKKEEHLGGSEHAHEAQSHGGHGEEGHSGNALSDHQQGHNAGDEVKHHVAERKDAAFPPHIHHPEQDDSEPTQTENAAIEQTSHPTRISDEQPTEALVAPENSLKRWATIAGLTYILLSLWDGIELAWNYTKNSRMGLGFQGRSLFAQQPTSVLQMVVGETRRIGKFAAIALLAFTINGDSKTISRKPALKPAHTTVVQRTPEIKPATRSVVTPRLVTQKTQTAPLSENVILSQQVSQAELVIQDQFDPKINYLLFVSLLSKRANVAITYGNNEQQVSLQERSIQIRGAATRNYWELIEQKKTDGTWKKFKKVSDVPEPLEEKDVPQPEYLRTNVITMHMAQPFDRNPQGNCAFTPMFANQVFQIGPEGISSPIPMSTIEIYSDAAWKQQAPEEKHPFRRLKEYVRSAVQVKVPRENRSSLFKHPFINVSIAGLQNELANFTHFKLIVDGTGEKYAQVRIERVLPDPTKPERPSGWLLTPFKNGSPLPTVQCVPPAYQANESGTGTLTFSLPTEFFTETLGSDLPARVEVEMASDYRQGELGTKTVTVRCDPQAAHSRMAENFPNVRAPIVTLNKQFRGWESADLRVTTADQRALANARFWVLTVPNDFLRESTFLVQWNAATGESLDVYFARYLDGITAQAENPPVKVIEGEYATTMYFLGTDISDNLGQRPLSSVLITNDRRPINTKGEEPRITPQRWGATLSTTDRLPDVKKSSSSDKSALKKNSAPAPVALATKNAGIQAMPVGIRMGSIFLGVGFDDPDFLMFGVWQITRYLQQLPFRDEPEPESEEDSQARIEFEQAKEAFDRAYAIFKMAVDPAIISKEIITALWNYDRQTARDAVLKRKALQAIDIVQQAKHGHEITDEIIWILYLYDWQDCAFAQAKREYLRALQKFRSNPSTLTTHDIADVDNFGGLPSTHELKPHWDQFMATQRTLRVGT